MNITLMSFSYKRKLTPDADMIFDVRFLKNPYYDTALEPLSGLDPKVGAHIESDKDFEDFYSRWTSLLLLMLKRLEEKGHKSQTIAVGCTGGRHRSVYLVEKLSAFLRANDYKIDILHRDLEKL